MHRGLGGWLVRTRQAQCEACGLHYLVVKGTGDSPPGNSASFDSSELLAKRTERMPWPGGPLLSAPGLFGPQTRIAAIISEPDGELGLAGDRMSSSPPGHSLSCPVAIYFSALFHS